MDYGGESVVRRVSPDSLSHQPTQEDRSLEDVLFGEEHFDDLTKAPMVANTSELIDEICRLRKQAEHTTSLLEESEAANGRLIEQSRCLKEEIRRLERNEERKNHLENTEYLKNVIVKVGCFHFCQTVNSVPDAGESCCREVSTNSNFEHYAASLGRRAANFA